MGHRGVTVETIQTSPIENPIYSVVIPIRDRYEYMLRNCLRSIELQTLDPIELIIVDYGSTQENHEKLLETLPKCTVYRYETDEPWSLARARNIGLRRATAPISCALDADLIMGVKALEYAYHTHQTYPNTYQTTQVVLLGKGAIEPASIELPRDYVKMLTDKSNYLSEGWGGFTSAETSWWHRCRGFDERLLVWGWEDVDMWKRAVRGDMSRFRLINKLIVGTIIYHQYHENVQLKALQDAEDNVLKAIKNNEHITKRSGGVVRNDENWGLWSED